MPAKVTDVTRVQRAACSGPLDKLWSWADNHVARTIVKSLPTGLCLLLNEGLDGSICTPVARAGRYMNHSDSSHPAKCDSNCNWGIHAMYLFTAVKAF
jgi:hypothetical protein